MCLNTNILRVESRNTHEVRYIDAPCGYCVECLKHRQNDWKMRMCSEASEWRHVYFFTLTYRDDALPCRVFYADVLSEPLYEGRKPFCESKCTDDDMIVCSTACKDDVQRWIKRFRINMERRYGARPNFKYFICAEYGPNPIGTRRPHYHGLMFTDLDKFTIQPMFHEWEKMYGRIDFQEVGLGREDKSAVSNYVSKYCSKGCFESRIEDIMHGRIERAWSIMSKNIGIDWLEKNIPNYYRYIPKTLELEAKGGTWTHEDVERLYWADRDAPYWRELDDLIDNNFMYDGKNFKYRLPRYYYERMYAVQKTFKNYDRTIKPQLRAAFGCCDCQSEKHFCFANQVEPITFFKKIREDKRYVHENFLSVALAFRLRIRALVECKKLQRGISAKDEVYYKDGVGFSRVVEQQRRAREARKSALATSLRNFYETNMWNHRIFDFGENLEFH